MQDDPLIEMRIGSYRVMEKLGGGAMATVYLAVHEDIERPVAIKILLPDAYAVSDLVRRLRAEARAVNIARHPDVVDTYDIGSLEDGRAYIVMEYVQGETLKARLARAGERLQAAEVLHLGERIARAMAAVHEKGIIHRDLKPANLMVMPALAGDEARVKILDFGIAKVPPRPEAGEEAATRTDMFIGTVQYAAPEQFLEAARVTARADVYSLGVILYEALSGARPFCGDPSDVIRGHMVGAPRPLRQVCPDVPASVAALVEQMMEKVPERRPSMQQVADGLAALRQSLLRPRRAWVGLSRGLPFVLTLAVGLGLGWLGHGAQPAPPPRIEVVEHHAPCPSPSCAPTPPCKEAAQRDIEPATKEPRKPKKHETRSETAASSEPAGDMEPVISRPIF